MHTTCRAGDRPGERDGVAARSELAARSTVLTKYLLVVYGGGKGPAFFLSAICMGVLLLDQSKGGTPPRPQPFHRHPPQ